MHGRVQHARRRVTLLLGVALSFGKEPADFAVALNARPSCESFCLDNTCDVLNGDLPRGFASLSPHGYGNCQIGASGWDAFERLRQTTSEDAADRRQSKKDSCDT